jgi:uncharacterized membrane protein (UPF0127 family)
MNTSLRWLCALLALGLLGCPHRSASADPRAKPATGAPPAETAAKALATAPSSARVVLLPPGRDPVSVRVEVARTEEERRRGLMFRKHMDQDTGMIFLFERAEPLTFWMHNTYIPLDMIFIDEAMRVLGIVENAEPLTDSARAVPGRSRYVLEVNAGFSRRAGIASGTAVRFEGVASADGEVKQP